MDTYKLNLTDGIHYLDDREIVVSEGQIVYEIETEPYADWTNDESFDLIEEELQHN